MADVNLPDDEGIVVEDATVEEEDIQLENDGKVISQTEKRLTDVFGKHNDTEDEDDAEDEDGPTAEEKKIEAELEAEKKQAEDDDNEEKTQAKDEEHDDNDVEDPEDPEDSDILSVPENYRRAAIHMGWTDESINELFEANPELANKTFANMLETVNRSSKEFAAIGRAKKDSAQKKVTQQADDSDSQAKTDTFKKVDVSKLREDGEDEATITMIEMMQDQNELLYNEVKTLKESGSAQSDQPSAQETAAVEQQISTFFRSEDLKSYDDFYGKVPKDAKDFLDLTGKQQNNRWSVVEMAEQMLIGADAYGQELSIDEALMRAHLTVTESIREKAIRDELKTKVVKRGKSLSLKPNNAVKPDMKNRVKDGGDLLAATQDRLAKVFG